jgi:hypothetical protein
LTIPRLSLVKKRHWFWFYWLVYTFGLIIASKPLTMFYIITCFLLNFQFLYQKPLPSLKIAVASADVKTLL